MCQCCNGVCNGGVYCMFSSMPIHTESPPNKPFNIRVLLTSSLNCSPGPSLIS